MTLADLDRVEQRLRELLQQGYDLERAVRALRSEGVGLLALCTATERVARISPAEANRLVIRCAM